jgi:penicillin-binding protein 1A
MNKVTKLAKTLGVGDYPNYLSISLGAGDTTVAKMTNAFAILANNGRSVNQTLVDYIQDRNGKIIYRADSAPCVGCRAGGLGRPADAAARRSHQAADGSR